MRVLLIDGYVDEPGCLGVPPYLAPYPRYIFGALKHSERFTEIRYITIDQLRAKIKLTTADSQKNGSSEKYRRIQNTDIKLPEFDDFDWIIFLTGVSVPGNYLGGKPIKFSELKRFSRHFANAFKILCGPATQFGIGEEGGKPSKSADLLQEDFDFIIKGDAEIVFDKLLRETSTDWKNSPILNNIATLLRTEMSQIQSFAIDGTELITQHPNFQQETGGNLICEIETFRGCPRYKTGGCSFCVEPSKGPTMHRTIEAIVEEIALLYKLGVRHFRLGNQTDFYAFQHGDYFNPRYPRPNPTAIESLLNQIRDKCPAIRTLHIDNVNALNFVYYSEEARKITQLITQYCTAGNIAAIGVESVDPIVIKKNNLKASKEEILEAVKVINEYGRTIGSNGNPLFLPGLNFIMGLPGETKATLDANLEFLKEILQQNLLVRRINLRKLLTPITTTQNESVKNFTRDFEHNEKWYFTWKETVREEIDFPMLKKVFPIGRVLTNNFAEIYEGNATFLRQVGTYPILCYVPKKLELGKEYTLIVIDHGFRSLTCLEYPINIGKVSIHELERLPGIGKKRALSIFTQQPKTEIDWLKIVTPEIFEVIKQLLKF